MIGFQANVVSLRFSDFKGTDAVQDNRGEAKEM